MPNPMTLHLPDDVLEALKARAAKCGRVPEDLAASWLSATVRRIANDPLLRLAGTIPTLPSSSDPESDEPEPSTSEPFAESLPAGAATVRNGTDG